MPWAQIAVKSDSVNGNNDLRRPLDDIGKRLERCRYTSESTCRDLIQIGEQEGITHAKLAVKFEHYPSLCQVTVSQYHLGTASITRF